MVILKSAMRQSFHRLEKPQISHAMAEKQLEEAQRMNQGVNLVRAKITNKVAKPIATGDLFIITLDIEGSDALPNDWSTFDADIYDRGNVGEVWQVRVSTKPKAGKPGEFYRNINEFVEIVEQSDRPQPTHYWDGEKNVRIEDYVPEEDEAIGTPYPPDDPTWWEKRLIQGLTAKDININIAVALKAVADVIVAKVAQPELYNPANAFDDLVAQTRRLCREVYIMPYAEQGDE